MDSVLGGSGFLPDVGKAPPCSDPSSCKMPSALSRPDGPCIPRTPTSPLLRPRVGHSALLSAGCAPKRFACGAHLILAAAAGPAHHLRSAERAEAGRGEHAPGQPQDAAALGSARHGLRPHCPSPKPHCCPVSEWTLGPAGLCHLPSRCSLCLWPGPDRAAGSRLRLLRPKLPDETQRPPPWSVRRVRPSPHSALP